MIQEEIVSSRFGLRYLALAIWVFIFVCNTTQAQPVSPSRGLMIRPTWKPLQSGDSSSGLGEFGGWGSVFHGFNSASDAFGWGIDIGVAIELYRWSQVSSLTGISDMELTANTKNDIHFHPRGGIWEEGLLYTHRAESYDWQIGYLHRCRHDVDNGENGEYTQSPLERLLIYGSLISRFYFDPIYLGPHLGVDPQQPKEAQIKPWIAGDLYVIREDYRQPGIDTGFGANYKNILFTLSAGANVTLARLGSGVVYSHGGIGVTAFGTGGSFFKKFSTIKSVSLDGNVELGLTVEGNAAIFDIYLGYQGMSDDGTNPLPQSSKFFLLGIRLRAPSLVL